MKDETPDPDAPGPFKVVMKRDIKSEWAVSIEFQEGSKSEVAADLDLDDAITQFLMAAWQMSTNEGTPT